MQHKTSTKFTTYTSKPFGSLIMAANPDVHISELDVAELRDLVRREHLVVLRGFSAIQNAEAFSMYCERWGEISLWPFGKVLELIEHENPIDHIFDHSYIPLHWDGMYRPHIPEFQIFNCVVAPLEGHGGRTVFSNTKLALIYASSDLKEVWGSVTGIYQRKMEFYNSKTSSPIIAKHPFNASSIIRYNEPPCTDRGHFINVPDLAFTGLGTSELESFHRDIKNALYSPANFYAHEWQTGDVVIADNLSLLHGREAFTAKSPRHLQRVHVLSDPPFTNPGLESYK